MEFKDLTGKKFHRWTVKGFGSFQQSANQPRTHWICECDCGKIREVYAQSLLSNKSKSCGCLKRHAYGSASRQSIYSCYKSKAKRHNLSFNITVQDFHYFASKPCYYCGNVPSNVHHNSKMNGDYIYNGLDRVDNSKGYELDNIVSSCKNCNLAKRQLTTNQFFDMIAKIYERHLE